MKSIETILKSRGRAQRPSMLGRSGLQLGQCYLVADVDVHAVLQVVQRLLQVAGAGRAQVAGVDIRLHGQEEQKVVHSQILTLP